MVSIAPQLGIVGKASKATLGPFLIYKLVRQMPPSPQNCHPVNGVLSPETITFIASFALEPGSGGAKWGVGCDTPRTENHEFTGQI